MTKPRILIMAGGTGGHIFPARAVATALSDAGWQIHWLGTATRMEATLVPQFGWPFHAIDVAGLRGKGMFSLLKAPWMLLKSVWQARRVINTVQPDLVLGFGGYASGPGGVAAWLKRRPLFIHEQNAVAGSTNRLLAKLAEKVLVAFPAAFAGHDKQVVVGNPVRAEIIDAAAGHNFAGSLKVLVVGGSLGAKALNDTLPGIFAKAAQFGALEIRHQTGKAAELPTMQAYQALACDNLQADVSAFIDDMAAAYAAADVVICRAGASTVSELACAGVAALFVPLPGAIDDHQTVNALWLTQQGAALQLAQAGLNEHKLLPLLQQWLQSKTTLQHMAAKARACALDQATAQVVTLCQQAVGQTVTGQQL
ncbi:undecaprenyldiphospho-muramoylpentapeptide beta-N-acetylglucosaminyltransferase [Rheinheimera sp. YQF-2]|uniref:UDP-N-acetylglucosamine--N-acetylmuramyl-(pentapeptide) pyrophosphoryl-undecaprenol N-acetylglucosamine transferase n=1 Tax=Rheinheimera lutimaris TaxID=2740584 RepID=A0A7Y5EI82_9GAMM|nr:undecaprenyldiphospho-muramoylpentapeptide beta-N-acetylglucosaminyltransferase [Rheinheimera lutimaris]NRQ43229.1 undecaprenyldiphospho-muramoylpentapeptide beta-N-acetylglucosaminyltransferase [Rheinheimera lutimaris]